MTLEKTTQIVDNDSPFDVSLGEEPLEMLHWCITRHLRGKVLLIGDLTAQFMIFLRRNSEISDLAWSGTINDVTPDSDDRAQWDTIVFGDDFAALASEDRHRALILAKSVLSAKGRLVVTVPNYAVEGSHAETDGMDARELRSLLKHFGEPKVVMTQPLRWLLMYVDQERPVRREDRHRFKVIARLCQGTTLELGCGRGDLSAEVARRCRSVTGVDMNRGKISAARRRYNNVAFLAANILDLPFSDPIYDTVILAEVLEHFDEELGDRVLEIAWQLVAPGGRLIVSVPNENCIPHVNHLREFTARSLIQLLSQYGTPNLSHDQPYKWLVSYVEN